VQGLIEYWSARLKSQASDNKVPTINMAEANALTATIKSRGAPFHKQVWFCLCRSFLQQYRLKSAFFFEIGVAAMAGFLIGLAMMANHGQNFRGVYSHPYELLSSSMDFSAIPQMSLLTGLAIGLIASAPGVKVFGEEKLVYWREAAAGHNRFAYYLGKVISAFPRMILACLHFTILFMFFATPLMAWMHAFIANFLYFYCIYGLASCISMVTRREDGPLLAVMSSLIVGKLHSFITFPHV